MSRLVLLLVGALALAGAWLLLRDQDRAPVADPDGVPARVGTEGSDPTLLTGQAPQQPAGRGRSTGRSGGSGAPSVIDPRTLPRGPLEVHVLDGEDQPVHSDLVTVDVGPRPGQPDWFDKPLARPDPDGHVWKGEDFLAGPVRVRVWGDHVVEQHVDVVVETQPTAPVVVRVPWAGSLEYHATRRDGSEPAEVRLTLVGARQQPVTAYYQVRTETVLTTPRRATQGVLGARGLIFGIPPGTYTLRAQLPDTDESDVRDVIIEARKTLQVELRPSR